jgi:hypothetical protein
MSAASSPAQSSTLVRLECDERLLRRMLHVAIQSGVAVTANEERAIADEFLRIVRRAQRAQPQPLGVHPYFAQE